MTRPVKRKSASESAALRWRDLLYSSGGMTPDEMIVSVAAYAAGWEAGRRDAKRRVK